MPYWAAVTSDQEADYLCGVLNAPITTALTRPLMSYGKDERDIHKHVWELPIPKFDSSDKVHKRIAALAAGLETTIAETFQFDDDVYFAAARRHIRDLMMKTPDGVELDELVTLLIG